MKTSKAIFSLFGGAVLAFLIEKALSPVLEFLYSQFLKTGTLFINNFSDSVYQSISNGFSDQSSITVLHLLVIVIYCGLLFFFFFIDNLSKSSFQEYDEMLKRLDKEHNLLSSYCVAKLESEAPKENPSDLINEILQMKEHVKTLYEDSKKSAKRFILFFRISILLLICLLFFVYGREIFINSAITRVTCNIEIVSPYVSDSEYQKLKSDFYQIKNESDFNNLCDKIDTIADTHSLHLKE